jgi:hypothetical protein
VITQEQRDAIEFFAENAGYCTPPGRMACAKELAEAEHIARANHWDYTWEDDDLPWDGDAPAPEYVQGCVLRDRCGGTVLASLWGIGINDWSDPYIRVVEAELAAQAVADTNRQGC